MDSDFPFPMAIRVFQPTRITTTDPTPIIPDTTRIVPIWDGVAIKGIIAITITTINIGGIINLATGIKVITTAIDEATNGAIMAIIKENTTNGIIVKTFGYGKVNVKAGG